MDHEEQEFQQSKTINASVYFEYENQIAELEHEKNTAAKEGRYGDADFIQARIFTLKKAILDKKKKDIEAKQSIEMEKLELAYRQEVDEYNGIWDKKVVEFEDEARRLEEELKERHAKELEEYETNLQKKLFKSSKFSKSYLELRAQEENLVKQQRFKEAQLTKKKADAMEKEDSEKWNKEKSDKVGTNSENLRSKQLSEHRALLKKLDIQNEVLKKERDTGFHTILHRFKNKKFDLEKQHKKELTLGLNDNWNKAKTQYQMRIKIKKAPGSQILGGSQEVQE